MVRTRAAEYEEAARRLRAVRDEVIESSGIIARSAPLTVASGGTLRCAIDETLGVIVQQCRRAGEELDRVALICTQRAALCHEFESRWAQWERQHERWRLLHPDERGWPPASPRVFAPWVLA